ncbi:hypothetical protein A6R68_17653, partial [Neotoma lepida]
MPEGLIILAVSPDNQEEYFALQLKSGRPYFLSNTQGSLVEVTTTDDHDQQYSDGQWHEIIVARHQAFGQITLDGQYTGSSASLNGSAMMGGYTRLFMELKSGLLSFQLKSSLSFTQVDLWLGLAYGDGNWNTVIIKKEGSVVSVGVNELMERTSQPGAQTLQVNSPVYVGGIPQELQDSYSHLTLEQGSSCISNVRTRGGGWRRWARGCGKLTVPGGILTGLRPFQSY